jgi:N-formylglutamate amidohydrolase
MGYEAMVDRLPQLADNASPMSNGSPPPCFEILAPLAWTAPAVFNSPHSGRVYPAEFLASARLSRAALRKSEDCYVDELFEACVDFGAPMLRVHTPRSYIDLNREPYELDPRMFAGVLPGYVNTASLRVAGGLGTIPRVVAEGEDIYRSRLNFADALTRIETTYRPYHRTLTALVDEVVRNTGSVLLVDCHSMPSSAASHIVPAQAQGADAVLGDRFGVSCGEAVSSFVEGLLRAEGLKVSRNKPYAGGFITRSHGAPVSGRHALQIEINRALYMNETTLEKSPGFTPLQAALRRMTAKLLGGLDHLLAPPLRQLAAE